MTVFASRGMHASVLGQLKRRWCRALLRRCLRSLSTDYFSQAERERVAGFDIRALMHSHGDPELASLELM